MIEEVVRFSVALFVTSIVTRRLQLTTRSMSVMGMLRHLSQRIERALVLTLYIYIEVFP